jgi:hypothetical protein
MLTAANDAARARRHCEPVPNDSSDLRADMDKTVGARVRQAKERQELMGGMSVVMAVR